MSIRDRLCVSLNATKQATPSIEPKRELLNREFALRTKAAAMEKQAQEDEKAAALDSTLMRPRQIIKSNSGLPVDLHDSHLSTA